MLNDSIGGSSGNIERYRDRLTKFSSEFELGLFLFIAKKSLVWLGIFLTIAGIIAFLYLRYTPPVYQAKSTIQINSNNKAQKILNVGNMYESSDGLAEAIEILRSSVFLKRVVNKLDLFVGYYNEGTFKANELYNSTPYIADINIKNPLFYNQKFYVSFKNKDNGMIQYGEEENKNKTSLLFKTGSWINTSDFDIKISLNPFSDPQSTRQDISKLKNMYCAKYNENSILSDIQSKIELKLINEQAKTIGISIKDFNSSKAADIVNAIAIEFQSYDVERESESSKNVLSFLDEQLHHVFVELKESESELGNFRKQNSYDNNSTATQSNMARLSLLEDQLLKVELDQKTLEIIQKDIQNSKSIDIYTLISTTTGIDGGEAIKGITSKIQELLLQKENLLYQVKPSSDAIKQINYQIDIQRKFLIESINALLIKMKGKYQNLKEKSNEFEHKNDGKPEKDLEYARLLRLFNINEKYYTLLLEKKTEFSISKAGFVSQSLVLEKAVPSAAPISPNRKSTFLIAFLSALLIGITIIFIRYFVHDQINSLNEITKLTHADVNILGIVPKYDKNIPVSQLVVDKNPKSLIAESFRSIRTNLQFISNEPGAKLIALTSTVSGEGKTFVALNLAGIMAFSGKKVIIIDLDMRKPKIHKGFGVENDKGMSTILINKHPIDECVNQSSVNGLDYITAGPIPPNPSELIISQRMQEVLDELKLKYDIIIADNPPVGLVTDAIEMIRHADYPIYVFRADYSRRSFIQIFDRLQNENNFKKLAVVLNGVDINRKNYGYNYGYGYGYGYGGVNYGYYEEKDEAKKKNPFKRKISVS